MCGGLKGLLGGFRLGVRVRPVDSYRDSVEALRVLLLSECESGCCCLFMVEACRSLHSGMSADCLNHTSLLSGNIELHRSDRCQHRATRACRTASPCHFLLFLPLLLTFSYYVIYKTVWIFCFSCFQSSSSSSSSSSCLESDHHQTHRFQIQMLHPSPPPPSPPPPSTLTPLSTQPLPLSQASSTTC